MEGHGGLLLLHLLQTCLKRLMSSTRPKEWIWQRYCRSLRGRGLLPAAGLLCWCFWTCSSDVESPPSAQQTWNKWVILSRLHLHLWRKGSREMRTPSPTVQHWMSLISQFTLGCAASQGRIILCISTSNCRCRLRVRQIQETSEEEVKKKKNCGTPSRLDMIQTQAAAIWE